MINEAKLRDFLDAYNEQFKKMHVYQFCRCYSCIFPLLIKALDSTAPDKRVHKLSETIQALNDDYMYSADYRMQINKRSGLECGYDCINYEERLEACPLPFWEVEKIKTIGLQQLIHILEDESFLSCFSSN